MKYVDLDVNALALGIGIDRQEIWELAGKGLGSGSQSVILSMKSSGKFYGDVRAAFTRFMNWAFLPDDCEFSFDKHDAQENAAQTQVDVELSTIATAMAAIPGISPLEIKRFLASRSSSFKNVFADENGLITVSSEDPKTPIQQRTDQLPADSEAPTPGIAPAAPKPQAVRQLPAMVQTPQQKSFSDTASLFEQRFTQVLQAAATKQITKPQADMLIRGLLLSSGTKAFADGLAEGGVTDGLDDDERAQVVDFVDSQSGYLSNMLDQLFAGNIPDQQLASRATMWTNKSLTDLFNQGRISADKNGYYVWKLGPTEEHCPDCQRLNGQVHRFKEFYSRDWIPQSNRLACGGWQCLCTLQKTSGPGRGRF